MLPLDIAIAIIFVAMLYIIYLGYTALTMAVEFWIDSNMKYNENRDTTTKKQEKK